MTKRLKDIPTIPGARMGVARGIRQPSARVDVVCGKCERVFNVTEKEKPAQIEPDEPMTYVCDCCLSNQVSEHLKAELIELLGKGRILPNIKETKVSEPTNGPRSDFESVDVVYYDTSIRFASEKTAERFMEVLSIVIHEETCSLKERLNESN